MRTTTIQEDGNTVTITTDPNSGFRTEEAVGMVYDALLACGYHPTNVAEAMIELGQNYLPKETQ
jgi:hypothetical protein